MVSQLDFLLFWLNQSEEVIQRPNKLFLWLGFRSFRFLVIFVGVNSSEHHNT
ncbi:hypothetical protein Hanom_Chr12g01181151 [Helianthus anomalus]